MGAAGGRGTAGVGGQRVPLKWQSAMRLFCSTSVRATKSSASACQDVPRHGQRAANSFKHLSLSLPAAALYATHARGGTVLRRLWACNFVSNFRLSSTQYQHRPKPALIPCSPALYLPASPPAASLPPRLLPAVSCSLLVLALWLSHEAASPEAFLTTCWHQLSSGRRIWAKLTAAPLSLPAPAPAAISRALSVYLVANALRLFMAPTIHTESERESSLASRDP